MKFVFSIIILFSAFISCKQKKENSTSELLYDKKKKDSTETSHKIAFEGCYRMIISNDTATMNVVQKGDSVTGNLIYKKKEKDSNTGFIHLVKTNSRAEGWYTYQSEGKTSVRQIVLKISGDTFAEGYGDIKMNGDTAVFKYPHALNFEEKHTFNKINCP